MVSEDGMTIASVEVNGKWGYLNLKGELVIKPAFDDAWCFESDGKAPVKIKNSWKYINIKGDVTGSI